MPDPTMGQLGASETLPIPPLEPTHYGFELAPGYRQVEPWRHRAQYQEVIFRMRLDEYQHRMEHEAKRLQRERQMEEALREKTQIILGLRDQVERLQTTRTPNVAALREAYANDVITLEEFDRLVLHCIGGES